MTKYFFYLFFLSVFSFKTLPAENIDLLRYEYKIYSQNGEDGIIHQIFETIGTQTKYYVEFGTENGSECNTRYLMKRGWTGLLMDGSHRNPKINLHQEYITAENINLLFQKYHVPFDFDLLSIDIDFNDFYVWHALDKAYQPRVVIIEYNATHLPHEDKVIIYDPKGYWDKTNYFGASMLAMYHLGKSKGYSLVYANGVNLFFIRDDIIDELEEQEVLFKHINDVEALYRPPTYGNGPNGGHYQDPQNRTYLSSKEILQSKDPR